MPEMKRAIQTLIDGAREVVEAIGESPAPRTTRTWEDILATGELTKGDGDVE